jgi:hypothetical protein
MLRLVERSGPHFFRPRRPAEGEAAAGEKNAAAVQGQGGRRGLAVVWVVPVATIGVASLAALGSIDATRQPMERANLASAG